MKPIKTFGLAALAALMAMAFVGASSAMAESTKLCSNDANPCTAVKHMHEVSVGKGKLLTGAITLECDVLFLSTSVGGEAAPQVIEGNFTYSNCGSCSATEENGPATIEVLKEGHEKAKVTGEWLVHVNCSGINCRYIGEGVEGTGKGPLLSTQANGEVSIQEELLEKESGFFCPSTSKLDLTTTALSATYIGPAKHVCIFVGSNKGLYLNANGTKCTDQHGTRIGSYELGAAWTNTPGEHVCAWVGPNNGFYLNAINGGKCQTPAHGTPTGEFALGVTQ